MQYLQEVRVDDNTYILDGEQELSTTEIGTGFWLLGFDRDGTCFEMTKISRSRAKQVMFDYGNLSLKDYDITDFGAATYYWNSELHDGGILKVH